MLGRKGVLVFQKDPMNIYADTWSDIWLIPSAKINTHLTLVKTWFIIMKVRGSISYTCNLCACLKYLGRYVKLK